MKPDPPIYSIKWGKKYPTKDKTYVVTLMLFTIFVVSAIFFSVSRDDEKSPNPIKGGGEELINKDTSS